jgi:hypothetical protein
MSEGTKKMSSERAPLLLIFGIHSSRMATLIRERPNLTARLIVAPREALHVVGAFLHLAPDATRPDADVADIVSDTDPRDLLSAALPGCSPRLYKALDRAGDRIHERKFYERLGLVSRSPFGDALLSGGDLDDGRLGFYEALSNMDPMIPSLRGALGEVRYHVEGTDCLLAFLRAREALDERDFRLPPKAGLSALVRRFQTALGRIPAPDPDFEPPHPYRLVSTTAELQRIGKAFRNCVALPNWNAAQHHFRLLDGSGVYLVADEPALLVALRRVGGGLWLLEQVAGPKNEAPPRGAQAALLRDLAAAGLKIVTTDPQSAFSRLDGEARRRRHLPDQDEDNLDDDRDDGIEVAVEDVAA